MNKNALAPVISLLAQSGDAFAQAALVLLQRENSFYTGVSQPQRNAKKDIPSKAGRRPTSYSVADLILQYARSRNGNVWTLTEVSHHTGKDKGYISTQLTYLRRKGKIQRVGRAEYVLSPSGK